MSSEKYIKLGKFTALFSFLIGTLIFGLYFFTSNGELILAGYGFITVAGIINIIVLILILIKASSDSLNRKKLQKTCGLMLINIPIMAIFILLVMLLLDNMRITFTNATQSKLTDINIVGCKNNHIMELEPNESKTVWVEITGDCSIMVEYSENGKMKRETVSGYVTPGMGQKIKHKINEKDKDIL